MFTILIFLIFLIQNILSQLDHKSLQLGIPDNGTILEDNGMFYYKLVIPSNIAFNSTNLAIRIKENDAADTQGDDFSDPDVYISKVRVD